MFNRTQKPPLGGLGTAVTPDTPSQEVIEARQESQIWTAYALSPYLRASDLKISVQDGQATLTGHVAEESNKELARQIALGVDGIKHVENRIVVHPLFLPPDKPAERAFGEVVDDATVTSAVKSKLAFSRYADCLIVDVSTSRGKVTLQGSATTADAKEGAAKVAMNTQDVCSVDNQLVVPVDNPGVVTSIGNEIADSWITAKVTSSFMYSARASTSDIHVDTKGGIVTLTGMVGSEAERNLAVNLASDVRGVKSVDSSSLTI
jgi:hyperosmotically inducible periplasmic protein